MYTNMLKLGKNLWTILGITHMKKNTTMFFQNWLNQRIKKAKNLDVKCSYYFLKGT